MVPQQARDRHRRSRRLGRRERQPHVLQAELEPESGRLVPPGDPEALGAALAELIDDADARRTLEERAAAAAAGPYSWDQVAEQTLGVYLKAGA